MSPGVKLAGGLVVVVGVTTYMAYVGASSSWQYYVTVDECLAEPAKLEGNRVRVSGGVAAGSLQIAADRSRATFCLQGRSARLNVVCDGAVPDNLKENMDVVVEGRLAPGGLLRGDKVLTRCASKYESAAADSSSASSTGKKSP
ncbi:MAG: cytochrome c maturation protein CcmE [Planctomycetia bacterium]|nr:cytochrome c maturation protein CcmE [Planctomycetia bacterium]